MNEARRKQIDALITVLEDAKAAIEGADIEGVKDEEQEYFDNMPESLQGGERGSNAEAAIGELDDAITETQNATAALDAAISALENAKG